VKKYEGLFILNIAGKEDGVKEVVDKISAEIAAQGGKITDVLKMDKRPFARTPDKKVTSGYFVNIAFEAMPTAIQMLKNRFANNKEIYRILFTEGTKAVIEAPKAPAETESVATETSAS